MRVHGPVIDLWQKLIPDERSTYTKYHIDIAECMGIHGEAENEIESTEQCIHSGSKLSMWL